MPTTVFNILGFAHKGSSGMSLVFPDVCKTPTPAGPVPIPYPNLGKSADTVAGSTKTTADGQMIANKGAKYLPTTGDEAGSVGGVVSGVIKMECEFLMYSMDVMVEGKNVCRLSDPLWHNKKNICG